MACCDHECSRLNCPEKALSLSKNEDTSALVEEDRPPPYRCNVEAESQTTDQEHPESKKLSSSSLCATCFMLLLAVIVLGVLLGRECMIG